MGKKKVIHMVTVSKSLVLMDGQLQYLMENNYKIGVVSSPGKQLDALEVDFKKAIPMSREISPLRDLKSLFKLTVYFRREKPDIVNTGTPKAGLLGIIASFLNRVPTRIYTLRGLRLETESGLKRKILWLAEKIACTLATEVICISPSLLNEAKKLNLISGKKGIVLGFGSSNGIQLDKYPHKNKIKSRIIELKSELGIGDEDFVLGYVGRIVKDKGIEELLKCFDELQSKYENCKLLIVGGYDQETQPNSALKQRIEGNNKIIHVGYKENPSLYYYLMDVLIFLTYREGFGNVSIEAQASGTPVITTNVTGAIDTVVDNVTGFIVPEKDYKKALHKIEKIKKNPTLKKQMGKKGRERAFEKFSSNIIWDALNELYKKDEA